MPRKGSLDGLRALDLSRLVPGPYATMILADLGVEVIKIEEPGTGDYMRHLPAGAPAFENLNRNKKSLALDLRSGRDVFLRVARGADIVVEGFRPGVAKRLGIGYPDVARVNPRAVYCSISGYGQNGPLSGAPGHDVNYLARSGILDATGRREPTIPGILVADLTAGLMAVIGILASLLARERTRKGQYVDVSMLDSTLSLAFVPACYPLAFGKMPERGRLPLAGGLACYDLYKAKDGRYVSLGLLERKFWSEFCSRSGLADLVEFQNEPSAQPRIRRRLSRLLRTKTSREWEASGDLPIAAVQTIEEAMRDPQVVFRRMTRAVGKFLQMAFPIKFSALKARAPGRAPELGEHTDRVLRAAGYTDRQILGFRRRKVVGASRAGS